MLQFHARDVIYPNVRGDFADRWRFVAGATISKYDIVYISSYDAGDGTATVKPADATASPVGALGIALNDASAGDGVEVVWSYLLIGDSDNAIDTSSASEGDPVYLSTSTAGSWTLTRPSNAGQVFQVGVVASADATAGAIFFSPGHYQEADPAIGELSDPGNAGTITVTHSSSVIVTAAGVETRSAAAPSRSGLLLTIIGGAGLTPTAPAKTVEVSFPANIAYDAAAKTKITFSNPDEVATLISVSDGAGSYKWALVSAVGAALS